MEKRPRPIWMQDNIYINLKVYAAKNNISIGEAINKLLELAEKQK